MPVVPVIAPMLSMLEHERTESLATEWLRENISPGFCHKTRNRAGNCTHGSGGAFNMGVRADADANLSVAKSCLQQCHVCERCRYISISGGRCSWYSSCSLLNLLQNPPTFRTAPVRISQKESWRPLSTSHRVAPRDSIAIKHSVLSPAPLIGGLCNQIMALVGYALLAQSRGLALSLPALSTNALALIDFKPGGYMLRNITFASIFDTDAFATALNNQDIRVVWNDSTVRGSVLRPRPMAGWTDYERFRIERALYNQQGRRHPLQAVEDAVLLGLRPTAAVQAKIERQRKALPREYGCIHARVEQDMQKRWKWVHSKPPKLNDYFSGVAAFPELQQQSAIFVAVGRDLSDADAARLNASTSPWGSSLVRSSQKVSWNDLGAASSYTLAAVTDFMVCREAAWFAGWPASTFAILQGTYRHLQGKGWYATCPNKTGTVYVGPKRCPSCEFVMWKRHRDMCGRAKLGLEMAPSKNMAATL